MWLLPDILFCLSYFFFFIQLLYTEKCLSNQMCVVDSLVYALNYLVNESGSNKNLSTKLVWLLLPLNEAAVMFRGGGGVGGGIQKHSYSNPFYFNLVLYTVLDIVLHKAPFKNAWHQI